MPKKVPIASSSTASRSFALGNRAVHFALPELVEILQFDLTLDRLPRHLIAPGPLALRVLRPLDGAVSFALNRLDELIHDGHHAVALGHAIGATRKDIQDGDAQAPSRVVAMFRVPLAQAEHVPHGEGAVSRGAHLEALATQAHRLEWFWVGLQFVDRQSASSLWTTSNLRKIHRSTGTAMELPSAW